MQIVIDIPEEEYQTYINHTEAILDSSIPLVHQDLLRAVINGTPLPKGHGDLIDIEKAKKFLYERLNRLNDDELYDIFSTIIDDMYNELTSVTLKTRWIPISERLPEIQQVVLLSLRSLNVEVGFRAKTEPYFYCHNAGSCYIEPQNVLAWQPLPKPYKKESD